MTDEQKDRVLALRRYDPGLLRPLTDEEVYAHFHRWCSMDRHEDLHVKRLVASSFLHHLASQLDSFNLRPTR